MSLGSFFNTKRVFNFSAALLILFSQVAFSLSVVQTAQAAGSITVSDHEGQLNPSGSYTNGNIKTYRELDSINFRFTADSSVAANGTIDLIYGSGNGGCAFFQSPFTLGTHDSSATPVVNVAGSSPIVNTVGSPIADGEEWIQTVSINFPAAGEAIVNYYVTLTDEAGDCSGSSSHTQFGDNSGDVGNTGAQAVSIPANNIIELPEILVQKWVDVDADGKVDRLANAGEWSFSLDGGAAVQTDSNGEVLFTSVKPDGEHTITELNGPDGQSFLNGSGENCKFSDVGVATATVASATSNPTNASCIFNNGVPAGQITIKKDAKPNNAQDFAFTTTGDGLSNFSLDDDANATLNNTKVFSGLAAGEYSVTEAVTSGWDLSKIECNTEDGVVIDGSTVTISLNPGDNISCEYTNLKRGTITVNKVTDPANDTTEFEVTATTDDGGVAGNAVRSLTTSQAVIYDVAQGTYNVNETDVAGWTEDDSDCQDLVVNATNLAAECTIYNTKLGSIAVVKDTLPNNEQDFVFTFVGLDNPINVTLDDDSDPTQSNSHLFDNLPVGSYEISEASTPGWELTSIVCDDKLVDAATAQISLSAGENVECTFTNTKLVSISGTKFESNAGDIVGLPGTGLGGWTIFLDLDNDGIFNNDDLSTVTENDGSYSFEDILYGTPVSLIEMLHDGWTQIFSPSAFTVDSADDVTGQDFGNFENNSLQGNKFNDVDGDGVVALNSPNLEGWTITLKLDSDNDNDFDDESVLATEVTDSSGFLFENLAPGLYQVCEQMQPGWTATYPTDKSLCWVFRVATSGQTFSRYFGNFQDGSVSGVKWNDINGNGTDEAEPRLSDWEITLYTDGDDDDTDLDDVVDVKNTDNAGAYSFTGLTPGEYAVCETQQAGWSQTFPVNNACHYLTIDESGEQNTANFGNQGRGSIKVIKQVDTDGDGNVDEQDSTDWTWNINGSGDYATGSGNSQSVAAGDFTVSEEQQDDYHVTSSSCTGEDTPRLANDSLSVKVSPGESVVCTFINTRDTGSIEIVKSIQPDNDSGVFNLNVDDTTHKSDASHADTTGLIQLPTGIYNINETSGTNTNINQYFSDYSCTSNKKIIDEDDGTSVEINIEKDESVVCEFTNRKAGDVKVTKFNDYNRDGNWDEDEPALPNWDMNLVSEEDSCTTYGVGVEYAEQVLAHLSDQPLAQISAQECGYDYQPSAYALMKAEYSYDRTQTTVENGMTAFTEVKPYVSHNLSETLKEDWTWSNTYCEYPDIKADELSHYPRSDGAAVEDNLFRLSITPGETLECFVGNYQDSELVLQKSNDQATTGSPGDIVTYTLTLTVPEDEDEVFNAEVIDLPPENVDVIEGTETASSNKKGVVAVSPTYASPGTWNLGDLVPGEVVTMSYQAKISDTISSGIYPDIAYATAYDDPQNSEDRLLYANADAPDPFVATQIAVDVPVRTLPDTGARLLLAQFIVPIIAIIASVAIMPKQKKGGRA